MDYSKQIAQRGSIFRRVSGRGAISFNGKSGKCEFELVQYHSGRILAFCSIEQDSVKNLLPLTLRMPDFDFEGLTSDGYQVQLYETLTVHSDLNSDYDQPVEIGIVILAQRAHFDLQRDVSSSTFYKAAFPLVNLNLPDASTITYSDLEGNAYSDRLLEVKVDSTPFYFSSFTDSPEVIKELEYTKGISVTSNAFTFFREREDLDAINSKLSSLNTILSFMQGTRINRLGCDIYTPDQQIVESWWYDAVTRPYSKATLFNKLLADEWAIHPTSEKWIECAQVMYDGYCARNGDWRLFELIPAFLDAASENDYLELRGLKVCGCVEMIRARYLALRDQTYLIPKERFNSIYSALSPRVKVQLEELIPDLPPSDNEAMLSNLRGLNFFPFRRALRQFCKEFGYSANRATSKETKSATNDSLSAFIDIRNSLVHYGRFVIPSGQAEEWTPQRVRAARMAQYKHVERMSAAMLAALMGWMQVVPNTAMPAAPDIFVESDENVASES